jgi:hypothetical protein
MFSAQSLRNPRHGKSILHRLRQLKKILLADRNNRNMCAAQETRGIENELARFSGAFGAVSNQISIHRTMGAARDAKDVMIIADQAHFHSGGLF